VSTDEIVEQLGGIYDAAVAELSLEDAIEVAEGLTAYLFAALIGLHEDAENE
jgi:hypothetical protein